MTKLSKTNPPEMLDLLPETLGGIEASSVVLCLHGLDETLKDDELARAQVLALVETFREEGRLLVLVGRGPDMHADLLDEMSVLDHPLPDKNSMCEPMKELLESASLSTENLGELLDAAKGLTSTRHADALGLGITGAMIEGASEADPAVVRRFKEEEIGKTDFLRVVEPSKTFDDLLGHEGLKDWFRRRQVGFDVALRERFKLSVPRGTLLVGPPGTGKTRLGEAVAHAYSMPFLVLDFGALFSSMLGESEENLRHALALAERLSPCVLLVDEIDSAIGGAGSAGGGGDRDGGTTERVINKLLTWMSVKTEPVFLFFTANMADRLPAAVVRKGRLDEVFSVDFPSSAERAAILEHYLDGDGDDVNVSEVVSETEDWSGAELEAIVSDARYSAVADGQRPLATKDLLAEVAKTVPVAVSMEAQVGRMREWAKKNARPTTEKSYAGSAGGKKRRRKVGV